MDPNKPSHVNNSGGNESLVEEAAVPWPDSSDRELRQRDTETREPDTDWTSVSTETNSHHKGASDKQRFNTLTHQKWTKEKVVTALPTGNKGPSAGPKPRGALKQVLFSQGLSDKNLGSERGQLDMLKQDLGSYAVPAILRWRWKEDSQGTTLEENWTDIVDSHSTMSKMQKHQQEALWEFVKTELSYINKLLIIKDLVIAALVNLHQHGFLLEIIPELLFSNLPFVLRAHQLFWQEVIYPMLNKVRKTGKPFDPTMLEAGCLQFHQRFHSYRDYCWEEEYCLIFARTQMENNPHFFIFVQWVETHPDCERMRLGDMQARPHQRITKYPLLLKAILKNTPDPYVQQSLRGMMSSVKSFLDSINDYLKVHDEQLALTISAQRVEGFELEGINEEIDKFVREICQFDLTCPIRGVGPEVVRKLLLEEKVKIRGRKDSKLEVVALLFSDVLLMTQIPKKGDRLKVVRPPLALDRTYCMTLKDSCSFVLIEVGELRTAMNVYIYTASTSESCSTWIATIQQAKETLRSWREKESLRRMENAKIQQREVEPVEAAKTEDLFEEEELLIQSERETFVDEFDNDFIIPKSVNGLLASKEAHEPYRPPENTATNSTIVSLFNSQPSKNNFVIVHKGQQHAVRGHEWIEMGVRRQQFGFHPEEGDNMFASLMENKKKVAWNNISQSTPHLDQFPQNTATDHRKYRSGHFLLLDEYPEIDYPTDEDSVSQTTHQPTSPRPEKNALLDQDTRKNYSYSLPVDMETSPASWTKTLMSPRLQRKRLITADQGPPPQTFVQGQKSPWSPSFSNPDNDTNVKKTSGPSSGSNRVLKLGSLKPKQDIIWDVDNCVAPDAQTVSEPETSDFNAYDKMVNVKNQRSASIPYISVESDLGPRLHSRSLFTMPQAKETQLCYLQYNPNGQPSPLEGPLERATARVRERDRSKSDVNTAPSSSAAPSQSHSDGDRDTDWEDEVKVMRHRALTVSKGWKEQLVDGDDDGDEKDSVLVTEGVNVDRPGWCFDDAEFMSHLQPREEGLLEGISRSLPFWHLQGNSEQEDGEYCQYE
ncbi:uncharacterized protein plekhg6 [Brachionichthys hirsutus]|uniref:uncharacterized protein plekhg6 n=1 Tax=Brachionichthys hirsutus TaxID=412623 RepID=UPI003604A7DF